MHHTIATYRHTIAMHKCDKCHQEFAKSQGLQRHLARKRPCIVVQKPPQSSISCERCGNVFSRADSLYRHKQNYCAAPELSEVLVLNKELIELRARLDQLENKSYILPVTHVNAPITTVNAPVTNINNVNVNVEITPWGSPLALSDADVEAALARLPRLAGTPALGEIVNALMELVKRAHVLF